jgi:hypothetical protein
MNEMIGCVMRKLMLYLFFAVAISCTESSAPAPADPCATLTTIPPYETFNANLVFSLPTATPSTFKDLTFGQAGAWYKTAPQTAPSQYWYTFYTSAGNVWDGSDGTIPPGALLGVGTNGNTVIFNFAGSMTRGGTVVPAGYTKDNACDKWDTKATFTYVLKVDEISQTVISAVLTVAGKGYAATYDCTSAVKATFTVPATPSDNTWTFLLNNTQIPNTAKTHVLNFVALNITVYRIG